MREQEMAFLGKISAGMTHEIKNVLAIIKESSGLLEDLLALARGTGFPYQEKFQSVLGNIQEQVQRGVDLTTRLNRFAHSMDEPVAVVELNGLLEQMVLLLQRMARLRKVQLEAVTTATAVKLRTDPFQLQLLITACVEQLLQQVAAGASIRLRHEPRGEKVAIVVETSGADEPPGLSAASLAAAFADLTEILGRLGAAIQLLEDAGGRGIGLSLPLDMP